MRSRPIYTWKKTMYNTRDFADHPRQFHKWHYDKLYPHGGKNNDIAPSNYTDSQQNLTEKLCVRHCIYNEAFIHDRYSISFHKYTHTFFCFFLFELDYWAIFLDSISLSRVALISIFIPESSFYNVNLTMFFLL